MLVIPLKLLGEKKRKIHRSHYIINMQDFSNKRNKLQKCSGCCPQSRCPKTSHHHVFTLWRNMAKLLQAWFPITWQLLIIQILFITSWPVKDVLQVKRPRCLVKIWNVSPWKCLSPTVSNKTDFTFARHFIYFFLFCFSDVFLSQYGMRYRDLSFIINTCGTAIQWKYIFLWTYVCVYFSV